MEDVAFSEKRKRLDYIDFIGLGLIGIFSFLYSIFYADFAEWHIQLPFLNFPIFVGEILLGVCIVLLLIKWTRLRIKFNNYHLLIFLFIVFILVKAFWGYYKFGPLAFRNAALFYYPFFGVIGYYLFNKKVFSQKMLYLLLIVFLLTMKFIDISRYYTFTYFALSIILLWKLENKALKLLFIILFLLSFPFRSFLSGSRTHIVGLIASFSFIFFMLCLLKIKKKYLPFVFIVLLSIIVFLIPRLYSKALSFLKNKSEIINLYNQYNSIILAKKDSFTFNKIPPRLYNKNIVKEPKFILAQPKPSPAQPKPSSAQPKPSSAQPKPSPAQPKPSSAQPKPSPAQPKYNDYNVIWRLFVWRDMLEELLKEKAWFGINFGKPQRSASIEILGWTEGEWQRDGWIAPHNSFIHIIYRAGIVGVIWIITIFSLIIFMIKRFLSLKSVPGVFLVSIFIYWIAVANFLVILELPHNAIPFWTLFGLTLAYAKKTL